MQRVTPEEAERLLHMAVSTELAFHADEIFDYAYRMYLTVPHKRVSAHHVRQPLHVTMPDALTEYEPNEKQGERRAK